MTPPLRRAKPCFASSLCAVRTAPGRRCAAEIAFYQKNKIAFGEKNFFSGLKIKKPLMLCHSAYDNIC